MKQHRWKTFVAKGQFNNPVLATEIESLKYHREIIAEVISSRRLDGSKAPPPPAITTSDNCLYTLERKHPFLSLYRFTQDDLNSYPREPRRQADGLRSENKEIIMLLNAKVSFGHEYTEPYLYCYKANSIKDIWKLDKFDFFFHGWAIYRRLV